MAAMKFLDNQIWQTPKWLLDNDILQKIAPSGATDRISSMQGRVLNQMFDAERLRRLDEAEAMARKSHEIFNLLDVFAYSKSSIFREVYTAKEIDGFRRNLQRAYVNKMAAIMKMEDSKYDKTNIKAICRGNLKVLKTELQSAIPKSTDTFTKYHMEDLVERINQILDPK